MRTEKFCLPFCSLSTVNLILLEPDDFRSPHAVSLSGRRFRHIQEILAPDVGQRLRVGIIGGQTGSARVAAITTERIELEVELDQRPLPRPLPLTLLLALPRPKVLKRVLQGVTAMGVKEIILINSWRVDKSYWQSPLLDSDQLREQMILGLEQAQDTILPEIRLCQRFKPFVEDSLPQYLLQKRGYLAHPGAELPCPAAVNIPSLLAVGPEGGFIPYEVESLIAAGLHPVHLGRRTLRVETAVSALIGRMLPA